MGFGGQISGLHGKCQRNPRAGFALQAAELAHSVRAITWDRLRSGVTQTAAAQANHKHRKHLPNQQHRSNLEIRRKRKSAPYSGVGSRSQRLSRYCARSSEGAVENALVLNEQEQALRRLGINLSNNQSAGAQEYEQVFVT